MVSSHTNTASGRDKGTQDEDRQRQGNKQFPLCANMLVGSPQSKTGPLTLPLTNVMIRGESS